MLEYSSEHQYTLYSVELKTDNPTVLEQIPEQFSETAEMTYYDRQSGTIILQFISTAKESQILAICDEYKKEVELDGSDRLTYKLTTIR